MESSSKGQIQFQAPRPTPDLRVSSHMHTVSWLQVHRMVCVKHWSCSVPWMCNELYSWWECGKLYKPCPSLNISIPVSYFIVSVESWRGLWVCWLNTLTRAHESSRHGIAPKPWPAAFQLLWVSHTWDGTFEHANMTKLGEYQNSGQQAGSFPFMVLLKWLETFHLLVPYQKSPHIYYFHEERFH